MTGFAKIAALIAFLFIVMLALLSSQSSSPRLGITDGTSVVAPTAPALPKNAVDSSGRPLAVGVKVEIVGPLLCDSLEIYRERKRSGDAPRRFELGKEVFETATGETAEVVAVDQDVVQVKLRTGRWAGRTGWIAASDVRMALTPDVVPQARRETD